jgi:hypothetical protein
VHAVVRVVVQSGGLATSANAFTFHGCVMGSMKLGGP